MRVTLLRSADTDLDVVNAARVSFNKQSAEFTPQDARLLRYLAEHKHVIPFAHPQIRLHLRVPLFVMRQLDRHKVGAVDSEISRRYVDHTPTYYVPEYFRPRAETKKQGSLDESMENSGMYTEQFIKIFDALTDHYEAALEAGMCPEQARMILPQSMYTEVIRTASLLHWSRVYNQRSDEHAQKEVQDVAAQIDEIMTPLFPVSWPLLKEFRLG